METQSIKNISRLRDEIKEQLKSIDKSSFAGQQFGIEQEYSFKGLVGGTDALMTDIGALIKQPEKFVRLSVYNDRQIIVNALTEVKACLNDPTRLVAQIENLKSCIRPFNTRYTKERYLEFDKEVDSIVRRKIEIEGLVDEIKDIKEQANQSYLNIEETKTASNSKLDAFEETYNKLEETYKDLLSKADETQTKIDGLVDLLEDSVEKNKGINESYTEVKTNEKLINSFAQKVQTREAQIDKIENQTNEYLAKLDGLYIILRIAH